MEDTFIFFSFAFVAVKLNKKKLLGVVRDERCNALVWDIVMVQIYDLREAAPPSPRPAEPP